ncbi:hypothetical protein FGB62_80g02 [Gracilaria domingensis]|nr:hypothetical protein FGB62_80g02 [Gracilaria domingensis]
MSAQTRTLDRPGTVQMQAEVIEKAAKGALFTLDSSDVGAVRTLGQSRHARGCLRRAEAKEGEVILRQGRRLAILIGRTFDVGETRLRRRDELQRRDRGRGAARGEGGGQMGHEGKQDGGDHRSHGGWVGGGVPVARSAGTRFTGGGTARALGAHVDVELSPWHERIRWQQF